MEKHLPTETQKVTRLADVIALTNKATISASLPEEKRFGRCRDCSCLEYCGSGYTCIGGGCGHHYDRHW